jgi:hypothetical protein
LLKPPAPARTEWKPRANSKEAYGDQTREFQAAIGEPPIRGDNILSAPFANVGAIRSLHSVEFPTHRNPQPCSVPIQPSRTSPAKLEEAAGGQV